MLPSFFKGSVMISKNQAKRLRALQRKKYRRETQQFLVEGEKSVLELLASDWSVVELYATPAFRHTHQAQLADLEIPVIEASSEELTRYGSLMQNHSALAIVEQPQARSVTWQAGSWVLLLDQVSDPGNLGSILRIADWYGFDQVVCSPETADLYNPKTLMASKGSFLRVQVNYLPLCPWLNQLPAQTPVLGAFLHGHSLHQLDPQVARQGGVLVLGNEAQGISSEVAEAVTQRVTIPAWGQAESLNVGMATAILCDNLRRLATEAAADHSQPANSE